MKIILLAIMLLTPAAYAADPQTYYDVVWDKTEADFKQAGEVFDVQSKDAADPWMTTINYSYAVFNANCYDTLRAMPADIFGKPVAQYNFLTSWEGGVTLGVVLGVIISILAGGVK